MATSASAIFDIIAPEYASDSDKAEFIGFARARIRTCFYGTNSEQAVALMAAHMMAFRDRGVLSTSGGEIASKREGDLSISYHRSASLAAAGLDSLRLTAFGQQLLQLRKSSGAFIGVTGGCDDGCPS